MRYFITVLIGLFFMHLWHDIRAQGCSDAGFCTMGAMKPDQPFNKKIELRLRSMDLSFYRGQTTLSPVIYVATADMNFGLNSRTSFQIKVPYQRVSGNLGETSGLADLSLCITKNIYTSELFDINLSLGTKIPTNDSNKDAADTLAGGRRPLPMYYQTSLGTYDFITGISLISREWLFAAGVQHPFNRNDNQFRWSDWPDYPTPEYLEDNDPAVELKRGTDVMLRIERNFRFSRVNFSAGLLPIYRITRDEIFRPATMKREKPDGTTGLALSAIITAGYNFNVRSGIKFLYGKKITQREFNPDGLTRNAVTTISYYYKF